jgi:hypothetical protein
VEGNIMNLRFLALISLLALSVLPAHTESATVQFSASVTGGAGGSNFVRGNGGNGADADLTNTGSRPD